ncbi:MAG: Rrf2 family transcriptional regulator [Deltaproteobacteria bacterium]|nr:MAG: Rrf2 family transcriptional regulator [Deltaproteobacteria bacterium]
MFPSPTLEEEMDMSQQGKRPPTFFSQTALYAFRAMVHLSLQDASTLVPSKDLAEETHIPVSYVSKIMRQLVNAGLVRSHRGHHGGFQLACPMEEITVLRILSAVDSPEESIYRCGFGWEKCSGENPCPMHEAWGELRSRFLEWAETTTLSRIRHYNMEKRYLDLIQSYSS